MMPHQISPLPPGRPAVINQDLRWHVIAVRPGSQADRQLDRLVSAMGTPALGIEDRTVVRSPDLVSALGAVAWVRGKLQKLLLELLAIKSAHKKAQD